MPDLGKWYSNPKQLMLTTALSTPLIIGTVVVLPKSAAYAAPSRLALTGLVFSAGIGGFTGFVLARRRYRDEEMMRRFGGASLAVRDTLSFLRNEQHLARRGRLPVLAGSMAAFASYTLAHWPQFAMLGPYRAGLGALSLGLLVAVPVLLLRNRTHVINAWFLRRYLKEQIAHLGCRPPNRFFKWRTRKRGSEPAVTVTGPGTFRIGGFDWCFDDFVKGAAVFGQVGSGKTMVLNSLLYALLASMREPGREISGLVLDAQGDFHRKLATVCGQLGRGADLVTLDPSAWEEAARTSRSIAWNPLDNDDDALEIATRLIAALRLIGLEQGNEGSFFLDSAKAYLRHAIALVRAAAGDDPASIVDVYRLAQEGEEETPLYHQLLAAISARFPGELPIEIADAIQFFEREWGQMADRQKSGVRGTITQLLDEFLVPPFREIFTGRSTVTIADVIDDGKLLYVKMPAADRERMSRLVNTLIKLEFEKHVLKRPNKVRPSFMLIDEFQTVYTVGSDGRGDSDFFERARESAHASIVAAQNVSAYHKRTRNTADVKNFLGNCAVKIFLRNTEEETNRWASALFGMRSEIVVNSSEQAAVDGGWSRRRQTSYSRSTKMLPLVPPETFMRLAIPIKGDPQHQHAESVIHLGSRSAAEHPTVTWPVNPLD